MAFHDAAYAVGSYAISLDSARQSAGVALEVFQRGVRAAHPAYLASPDLLPTSGPVDLRGEPVGMEDRLTGIEKLDGARRQLDRAGSQAARTVRDAMAGAPRQVTSLQHAVAFVRPELPWAMSEEKTDFAFGGARCIADMVAFGTDVAGAPFLAPRMSNQSSRLDHWEWRLGVDPRSGFHTAGSILIPAAATLGVEGLVA